MLIKLTDENHQTRGGMQWGEGVTNTATGDGKRLCSGGVIHVYEGLLTAAFMYPAHVDWRSPVAWECEAEIIARDGSLKAGAKTVTTLRRVPLPQLSPDVRVRVAIMCAKVVCSDAGWNAWADRWLSGEDRSREAAERAARAAAAAWAEAPAAAWAAERSAEAAAGAAARAAARAEAPAAAWAAERSAAEAARSSPDLDLEAIIAQAIADEGKVK